MHFYSKVPFCIWRPVTFVNEHYINFCTCVYDLWSFITHICVWQFNDQKHDYLPPLLYVNLTTLSQNCWCHSSDCSSFPLRRPKFNPRPIHVQRAVELVAPRQVFSKYIWFPLTVIIPWILHTFRSLSAVGRRDSFQAVVSRDCDLG